MCSFILYPATENRNNLNLSFAWKTDHLHVTAPPHFHIAHQIFKHRHNKTGKTILAIKCNAMSMKALLYIMKKNECTNPQHLI